TSQSPLLLVRPRVLSLRSSLPFSARESLPMTPLGCDSHDSRQLFPRLAQVQSGEVFPASRGRRKHLLRNVWQSPLHSRENLYRFLLRNVLTKLNRSPARFALQSVVVAFTGRFPPLKTTATGERILPCPVPAEDLFDDDEL